MVLIEVFNDPDGRYLGAVAVDTERLPFKRFCGRYWWNRPEWKILRMQPIDEYTVEVRRALTFPMEVLPAHG